MLNLISSFLQQQCKQESENLDKGHGRPQEGAMGGHLTLPGFQHKFSHVITVAPRVEIQMHFWKGAKFAGSVGHPMTKKLSASGVFRPLTP